MNCFQICIFVLIATTIHVSERTHLQLWIAFKFVSLYWSQQQLNYLFISYSSCELLSNLYLCTDRNNLSLYAYPILFVVNCFQICIFVLIATTTVHFETLGGRLWIAFKFVSLYWSQQHYATCATGWRSCELLSNLYLCTDRNNRSSAISLCIVVVNCFQICIFVLIATTALAEGGRTLQLWIAFKFVSLYWSQQQ